MQVRMPFLIATWGPFEDSQPLNRSKPIFPLPSLKLANEPAPRLEYLVDSLEDRITRNVWRREGQKALSPPSNPPHGFEQTATVGATQGDLACTQELDAKLTTAGAAT